MSEGPKQRRPGADKTAVAAKLAVRTGEFFAERRAQADFAAFDRLMRRPNSEPPRPDDQIV